MAKEKCTCRPIVGILSLILMTAGLYFLLMGFVIALSSAISWNVWSVECMLSLLVGVVLVSFGKMAKYKGFDCCKLHSK